MACSKDGIIFCQGDCGAGTMKFSAEFWAIVVFETRLRPLDRMFARPCHAKNPVIQIALNFFRFARYIPFIKQGRILNVFLL
jgi:hypothetical protein